MRYIGIPDKTFFLSKEMTSTIIRTELIWLAGELEWGRRGAPSELLYYWWCSTGWVEQWAYDTIKSMDYSINFKESHESYAKEDSVLPYWISVRLPCACSPSKFSLQLYLPQPGAHTHPSLSTGASLSSLHGTLSTHSAILMHAWPQRAMESASYRPSLGQETMGTSEWIWSSQCIHFMWFSVLKLRNWPPPVSILVLRSLTHPPFNFPCLHVPCFLVIQHASSSSRLCFWEKKRWTS